MSVSTHLSPTPLPRTDGTERGKGLGKKWMPDAGRLASRPVLPPPPSPRAEERTTLGLLFGDSCSQSSREGNGKPVDTQTRRPLRTKTRSPATFTARNTKRTDPVSPAPAMLKRPWPVANDKSHASAPRLAPNSMSRDPPKLAPEVRRRGADLPEDRAKEPRERPPTKRQARGAEETGLVSRSPMRGSARGSGARSGKILERGAAQA